MNKNKLLDSYAILLWIQDEPGAQIIEDLLLSAKKEQINLAVSEINLGEVYYKCIRRTGKNRFELRIHYGPGYRVYFGDMDGVIVILLCGGSKRTQNRDIKKAGEYWQELKGRT